MACLMAVCVHMSHNTYTQIDEMWYYLLILSAQLHVLINWRLTIQLVTLQSLFYSRTIIDNMTKWPIA